MLRVHSQIQTKENDNSESHCHVRKKIRKKMLKFGGSSYMSNIAPSSIAWLIHGKAIPE